VKNKNLEVVVAAEEEPDLPQTKPALLLLKRKNKNQVAVAVEADPDLKKELIARKNKAAEEAVEAEVVVAEEIKIVITKLIVKTVDVAAEEVVEVEVAEDVIMTTKIEKIVPKMKTNGFTSSIMKNSESSTITTLQLSLVRAKFQKCLLKKKD